MPRGHDELARSAAASKVGAGEPPGLARSRRRRRRCPWLTARAGEPEHQARRQRPRLVAEVGHLADQHADLLLDLAAHGVLEGLARLAEAGERRPATRRPGGVAAEQDRLVVPLPWVIAMITAGSVRGNCGRSHARAPQLVAGGAGLEACRRSAGRTGSRSATRPARSRGTAAAPRSRARHRRQRGKQRAQRHPLVALAGRLARRDDDGEVRHAVARRPSSTRVPSGASAGRDPLHRAVDGAQPGAGHDEHPRRPGRPTARRATRRRCAAVPAGCARGRRGRRGAARESRAQATTTLVRPADR